MIICPHCASALADEKDRFTCTSCPYVAERNEGIVFFEPGIGEDHEDYRSEGLEGLYDYEKSHPWFRNRVRIILKAFATYVERTEDILEVGAGTGYTARALLEDGYRRLSIGEIHRNGLLYAKRHGLEKLYQFDLRLPPFREHFDVVALFDVLEHIADDALAIRNIRNMLKPRGRLLLTVPAHRWLWSRIDELSGHHRRYDRTGLAHLLDAGGFEVLESRYFFTALVPGLLIRSFLARRATRETAEKDCGLKVSGFGNLLMGLATGAGDRLLFPLRKIVGGSLLTVARKR